MQNPLHNVLSDLYIFASGGYFGLTPCAPIHKSKVGASEDEIEFYGALCYDIDPSGSLKEYFDLDTNMLTTHLLFNIDQAFE